MTQNGVAITLDTVNSQIVAFTGSPRERVRVVQAGARAERRAHVWSPSEIEIGSSSSYSLMHYGAQGSVFVRAFKEVQLYA